MLGGGEGEETTEVVCCFGFRGCMGDGGDVARRRNCEERGDDGTEGQRSAELGAW
jgi:hypothetical protein